MVLVVQALDPAHPSGTGYLTVMVTLSLGRVRGNFTGLCCVLDASFALSLPGFVTVPWQDYLDLLLEVNTDEIPQLMRAARGEW